MFSLSCLSALFFGLVGLPFHLAAKNRGIDLFREKGFLRPPSGWEWVPFLFHKHYNLFEDSRMRWFFAISRICLLGLAVSFSAVLLLIANELLLGQVSDMP